ncbi:MAG: hypothetical protein ACK4G5_12240, partial [Devosia sp.]
GQTVLRANLAENDAALATGLARGAVKLVVDRHGTILGAGAVGPAAGETIAILALAMARGLNLAELDRLALPEPSLLATLTDLADQFIALHPPRSWAQRLPMLARLRP